MKKVFLLTLSILLLTFLLPMSVKALTVGPVKLEYSVDPGDVLKGQVFLMNEIEVTKTFYPVFEKYIEVGNKKKFLSEEPSMAKWFEMTSQITLSPQEQSYIPFTLRVPEDVEPGGHFAVMWWSTAPPAKEGSGQMAIVTRAGILIYLRVSGDVKESGELIDFSANKRFFSHLPVGFSTAFESTGNVHLKPKGEIIIKNIFGRTKSILEINEFGSQVFPQSRKSFQSVWGASKLADNQKSGFFSGLKKEWQGFAFGPYRAKLKLVYGELEQQIEEGFIFFVLPWRILIFVILILVILIFGVKKYNRWLIAKARK